MSEPTLDIDWTSFVFEGELERTLMEQFDGFTDRQRVDAGLRWQFHVGADLQVRHFPTTGRIAVAGSPHKMVHGESVGVFGPAELKAWVSELALLLGVDMDQIEAGRMRRIDIAANLVVSAPPCEYIALTETPSRMSRIGSGATTATFKNGDVEITFYDKVQKLRAVRRMDTLPAAWTDKHVLRVEVRFKKVQREFGRVVTVGDLCDASFWPVVAQRYLDRVSSVGLRRAGTGVPMTEKVPAMKDVYAALGIQAAGGADLAVARLDAFERVQQLPDHQVKRQRAAIRKLVLDHAPGNADLADEMWAMIEQAVASARGGDDLGLTRKAA